MSRPDPDYLVWRERSHGDSIRWEEIWDGEVHLIWPMPNLQHQDVTMHICTFLYEHWERRGKGEVALQFNLASIGGWPNNIRIPDTMLIANDRKHILREECVEGPPNVVVEVMTRGDESYDKLGFYASLGVPETWIIDHATKAVELFRLEGNQYALKLPSPNGWMISNEAGFEMQTTDAGALAIRVVAEPDTTAEIF